MLVTFVSYVIAVSDSETFSINFVIPIYISIFLISINITSISETKGNIF